MQPFGDLTATGFSLSPAYLLGLDAYWCLRNGAMQKYGKRVELLHLKKTIRFGQARFIDAWSILDSEQPCCGNISP